MSFDIPEMHIADNSPEARAIEAIVAREHVSPEELVRRALRALTVSPPDSRTAAIRKRKTARRQITEANLETLRQNVPIFAFLEPLPDRNFLS